MKIQTVRACNIEKKRVFLRADLNIPIKNGIINDDYRIKALLPTLKYLQQAGCRGIIASHLGNPPPGSSDPSHSLKQLTEWFHDHSINTVFAESLEDYKEILHKESFVLLENLRLFPGEKHHDISWAQELANLADIYVNDAFGTLHRDDTSITLLPAQFKPENRCIGLLVEKELNALDQLRNKPTQPFMLVLGGAKLDDKIPLIERFMTHQPSQQPSAIMIGGALAFPFLVAQGDDKKSTAVWDQKTIQSAQRILDFAEKHNIEILLPIDWIVAPDGQSVDIGKKTITLFAERIARAQTIFTNGTMGMYENPEYQTGTRSILEAIAHTSGFTVAGGGDCAAAVHKFKLADQFGFISTGGGATLAYLAASNPYQELAGLRVLSNY